MIFLSPFFRGPDSGLSGIIQTDFRRLSSFPGPVIYSIVQLALLQAAIPAKLAPPTAPNRWGCRAAASVLLPDCAAVQPMRSRLAAILTLVALLAAVSVLAIDLGPSQLRQSNADPRGQC